MTLYLKDYTGNVLVDIELWQENGYIEISSVIGIKHYTYLYINASPDKKEFIIKDFEFLQEIRGWLWEQYFVGKQNNADRYKEMLEVLRLILQQIANKYDLHLSED